MNDPQDPVNESHARGHVNLKLASWVSSISAIVSVIFLHKPWLFVPFISWLACFANMDTTRASRSVRLSIAKQALIYSLAALLPSSLVQFLFGILTLELFPRDDDRLISLIIVGNVWLVIGLPCWIVAKSIKPLA